MSLDMVAMKIKSVRLNLIPQSRPIGEDQKFMNAAFNWNPIL